jgi:predicted ATP-dependent Lon-type protease
MSAKYAKLTKSELLLVIDQLESEAQELSDFYEAQIASSQLQTVPQLWENFVKEAKLLGEDLIKFARFVYDAGVKAKQSLSSVAVLKPSAAVVATAEVVEVGDEFEY